MITMKIVPAVMWQSRELELSVYWKDWRQMCATKFLRLEDFLDNQRHGITVHMEPQGIVFAEVRALSCTSSELVPPWLSGGASALTAADQGSKPTFCERLCLLVGCLTLCWVQHGRLFTSCKAGLVWLRTSLEHTDLFAQLL